MNEQAGPSTAIVSMGTSVISALEALKEEKVVSAISGGASETIAACVSLEDLAEGRLGGELATLWPLLNGDSGAELEEVILLSSDTELGGFTSQVVAQILGRFSSLRIYLCTIVGLESKDPNLLVSLGLKNLMRAIGDIVVLRGNRRVVFCATGGYKATVVYAGVASQVLQIPIINRHFNSSENMWLPCVPINIESERWEELSSNWYSASWGLLADSAPLALKAELSACIQRWGDGGLTLSAAGTLYHSRSRMLYRDKIRSTNAAYPTACISAISLFDDIKRAIMRLPCVGYAFIQENSPGVLQSDCGRVVIKFADCWGLGEQVQLGLSFVLGSNCSLELAEVRTLLCEILYSLMSERWLNSNKLTTRT